jgi:hypothetical protein
MISSRGGLSFLMSRHAMALSSLFVFGLACSSTQESTDAGGTGTDAGGRGGGAGATPTTGTGGSSSGSPAGTGGQSAAGSSGAGTAGTGIAGGGPGGSQTGGSGASGSAGDSGGSGGPTGTAGSSGPGGAQATGSAASGGSAGGAAAGGGGAAASGGKGGQSGSVGTGGAPSHNELILYDDNGGRLLYVNNANPSANWTSASGTGRDLQLIGGGKVMLGKSDGWDEYLLSNGMKVGGQHGLSGTQAVHRLADGTTVLATTSGGSIVLKMVDATGKVASMITYPGFSYVRLVRPTSTGTFLVGADTMAFEGDDKGNVLWKVTVPGGMHTWKAMRLANGNVAVTSGYGATLVIFDSTGKVLQTIGGKSQPNASAIAPEFYADFHVMPNGNFFVVNSQADRVMDNSIQLLEYNPAGMLVWQQKQPMGVHSVEEAIVLDGLDTTKLQVEPQGELMSAP